MTNKTRATKGGEYGKNGEWYEGGQFLPSSKTTVKGEFSQTQQAQQAQPRKQEIAPYKWEVSDKKSIWKACGVGYYTKFTKTGYSKDTGTQGYLELIENRNWEGFDQDFFNEMQTLIDRWNNGKRWM